MPAGPGGGDRSRSLNGWTTPTIHQGLISRQLLPCMQASRLMLSRDGKRKQELTCTLVVVIKPVLGNTFDGYLHGFSSVNRHGNQGWQAPALSSTGLRLKGHGLRRVANERKRRQQA